MSSPAPTSQPHFQQRLGLFDATMLVMGTMIGSGIFVTTQEIAGDVGGAGWLLAVWALAGFMTLLGALSYTELAGMYPKAGGQYIFLKEAYSPLWGFLYGWTCFLVIQTGSIAAVAVAFAKFLGVLVPWISAQNTLFQISSVSFSTQRVVAIAVIALLTWSNSRGLREGKIVQNVFTS